MRSTFHSLETAKRALFTQTAALGTTGHNIANANTVGYSRQVVKMQASLPMEAYGLSRSTIAGQMGTGVEFTSINRIREQFLDDQFRGENSSFGGWNIQADTLSKLEAIFTEPSDTGLRMVMDKFFSSWSDLSKNPEDPTARKIVVQTAQAFTDALNYMSGQLDNLDADLGKNVDVKAMEINTHLASIQDLNRSITRIESLGDDANDLRDQRDLLTDQLSKIINITVTEGENGYNISMGAQMLIEGDNDPVNVNAISLDNAFTTGDLKGGEVHGMLVSRKTFVADYKNQLNNLASTIVGGDVPVTIPSGSRIPDGSTFDVDIEVSVNGAVSTVTAGQQVPADAVLAKEATVTVKGLNGLHQLGYTMDGTTNPGLPFFMMSIGENNKLNINLNPEIAADPSKIATSMRIEGTGTAEKVVKGNNTLALLIAGLNVAKFSDAGGTKGTIASFFSSMVGQLGIQAQEANRQTDNAYTLVTQVEGRRQSVSGVSLDEEMTNMIKFQHAYSASARFMTTFDQVLDKLINSTGVVGR
ncbi:flagellar hook-associated protein FlgK [Paenibacillus sp. N3/727]|uniref:flagellar hook-associated protein FlgK n=1 Tax=Paenibacillus sp. N3/727 TaxID=2925845 RepID=UPI001F5374BD|nr:flagellar hook-associated protein FlgK [Paenibacillus sp. N3/727]UNK18073.1 flagellar hook-associated protein FlgK [Paenibacillus sp. N3/727]